MLMTKMETRREIVAGETLALKKATHGMVSPWNLATPFLCLELMQSMPQS